MSHGLAFSFTVPLGLKRLVFEPVSSTFMWLLVLMLGFGEEMSGPFKAFDAGSVLAGWARTPGSIRQIAKRKERSIRVDARFMLLLHHNRG
jgi:hypothetical protein